MDKKAEAEIYSLEQSVFKVVAQSKKVAMVINAEPELLEELQQIAIALHYTMQTLRIKLGMSNVSGTAVNGNIGSSTDILKTMPLDLKQEDKQKAN